MGTFLLGVGGERLLQVVMRDERGSAGSVLALTSHGSQVRLLPTAPPPSHRKGGEPFFPALPQGLTSEHLKHLDRLVLDTSELPSALLTFTAEPFIEQAVLHAQSSQAKVRLTLDDAEVWGLEPETHEF